MKKMYIGKLPLYGISALFVSDARHPCYAAIYLKCRQAFLRTDFASQTSLNEKYSYVSITNTVSVNKIN